MIFVLILMSFCICSSYGEEFIKANNLFTPTIYKQVSKKEKDNFLISPFSAETILALTLHGCKGETAQELRQTIHLPEDLTKIRPEVKTLLPNLRHDERYTLHTANKMYIKSDFSIKNEFKKIATEVFHSDSENIDFTKNGEAAERINSWVKQQTENKIQNLVSPRALNNRTRVVLTNALYFKANWSEPFLLSNTEKITFFQTPKTSFQVDAMRNGHLQYFLYHENENLNAKFLELPFKGNEASMTFVLPNEKEGLASLENQIDQVFLPRNLTNEWVEVSLPKFRIENKLDLKEALKNLGVKTIFKDFEADLSGIAGEKGDLVVSEIIQKSFIDVNEEGVEAAAATFVVIPVPESGIFGEPKYFIADHPFIFFIKVKGVIIFAGRVTEPILSKVED